VETAPKKQADVANAKKVLDNKELEKKSEEELVEHSEDESEEELEEESEEESEEEEDLDQHSDQQSEEDKGIEHEGVHDEVALQGGSTHGNTGQLPMSFSCICILFSIPDIVMLPVLYHVTFLFQSKEVIKLIDQTSTNSDYECLPHAVKAGTNYAERKVHLGDPVESDASKYSPNSAVSDEAEDKDKKPKVVKTKSPLRKEPGPLLPLIRPVCNGDDMVDVNEEEVSII
jgi:hypothetical protein